MRSDMDKVIVERPRYGSRLPSRKKGYRKLIQTTPFDELPTKEPLLGRWKGLERCLNEHLGPMRRFLRSNVGRPWNNVHRELCEHISFSNAVQAHVLQHIEQYVRQNVIVESPSNVYMAAGNRWFATHPLRVGEMYVCPHSALLKVVEKNRRNDPLQRLSLSDEAMCLLRDNSWWEVKVRRREPWLGHLWDVWLERDVSKLTSQETSEIYGDDLFATSKRLLMPDEAKKLIRKHKSK
ncbi:MAG: hypothetical protein MUC43_06605 [Pirellula sp.]|jgi:hypothetical protein|nr:hypothetical protein [Pirellula sp.]